MVVLCVGMTAALRLEQEGTREHPWHASHANRDVSFSPPSALLS